MLFSEQDHKERTGNNQQQRTSFGTGGTTQSVSNSGKGAVGLGADAAKQGAETDKGSDNEKDKLGNSSTDTSNEGTSSPDAGAADTGQSSDAVKENSKKGQPGWSGEEERNDTRRKQDITPDTDARPREGDRRDISADQRPGFDIRFRQTFHPDSRGWSRSSMEEN